MHAYSHPPSLEISGKVEVVLVVLEVFLCSLETHLTFLVLLIQYYLAAEHDFVFYRYPCLLLMLLIDLIILIYSRCSSSLVYPFLLYIDPTLDPPPPAVSIFHNTPARKHRFF